LLAMYAVNGAIYVQFLSINDKGHKQAKTATYMPVKTIQFIYTMHNKILTIGSSTLKYKMMT